MSMSPEGATSGQIKDELIAQERGVVRKRGPLIPPSMLYLLKRLGVYITVLVVSVVLNFLFPRLMPNDPAESMIRDIYEKTGQAPSPFVMKQIHNMYGDPNLPIHIQFWNYIKQLAAGDLGRSIKYYPVPVQELIANALPWTLWLGLTSILIGWLIGTYFGARLGWRPGSLVDGIVTPVSMFFSNIPAFWLGLLAVWILAYDMRLFPPQGSVDQRISPQSITNPDWLASMLEHSILPLAVLIITGFAGWLFSMRNMMITTINEDYVHLARAKGLKPSRIRTRYAARNALLPNITGLAQAIGGMITAIVLAEAVFVYPGLGGLVGAATGVRDYPLMQALMLMIIVLSLIFNFIADSVYVILDPRTRETK